MIFCQVKTLILRMLEKNPKQRISVKDIYNSFWFSKFNSANPQIENIEVTPVLKHNLKKKIQEESLQELCITVADQISDFKETKDKILENSSIKDSSLRIPSSENFMDPTLLNSQLNITKNQNVLLIPLSKVFHHFIFFYFLIYFKQLHLHFPFNFSRIIPFCWDLTQIFPFKAATTFRSIQKLLPIKLKNPMK